MKTGKKDLVCAQIYDHADIVVFEGIPKISEFAREKFQPGARIRNDVIARLARPVIRNFRAFQGSASCGFGLLNRVPQHLTLAGVQTRKARIAVGFRIVSKPKVYATMRGQEYVITRDGVVVDPAGRGADEDADDKQRGGAGEGADACSSDKARGKEKRNEKQNRGDAHRGDAHEKPVAKTLDWRWHGVRTDDLPD